MNLTTASRTLQLLGRILDPRSATEPFLPPRAEKRALPLRPAEQPLPRCAPEEQGISSRHIQQFLEELDRDKALYMQDVMVLRRGCVLCEAAFGSQDLRAAKSTFSACKSVTSLAVGLLVDDGVLDLTEKVADIFGDLCTPAVRRRLKDLTVEHLLTMRAGIQFSEAEALTEADWVRRFLNASVRGEPGTDFLYNSLNSYILSAIIALKAGKGVHQLVRERLFAPLGITDTLWETCPAGIDKGGWGFYIRPEDMAKLGQLVLDGGLWQGERLLSQTYLDAALTAHAVPPETTGDFNYGYHIWVGRRENTFLFNGMLGQNVLGFRDSGILLVTNAGADTDFQESRYFEMVSRYFGGAFPDRLEPDPDARRELEETASALSAYRLEPQTIAGQDQALTAPFLQRSFAAAEPKAVSAGLLPVALQALHNNYTAGVTSLAVSVRGDLPELIYRERDAVYRFPVGLGVPQVCQLDFRGNAYHTAVLGRFTHDEEERPVFYIRMDFLETPCVRTLKLVAEGDGLLLRQSETPGVPYVFRKLQAAAQSGLTRPLLLVAAGGTEEDYLLYKTLQLLSPEIVFRGEGR